MAGKTSELRKQIITENIKYIENIKKAMQMILDGISETEACETCNIDKSRFRHLIAQEKLGYTTRSNLDPNNENDRQKLLKLFPSWQEILFYDINQKSDLSMPNDINESVDYVIKNMLTENERKVIKMLYKDDMTYIEIANMLSITAERVRQIKINTLHKMRKNNRFDIMQYGLRNFKFVDNYRKSHTDEVVETFLKNMDIAETSNISEININTLRLLRDRINAEITNRWRKTAVQPISSNEAVIDSIEQLHLSPRTYNCCIRSGYHYVSDFVGKTRRDIIRIRSMGVSSANELINELESKGIKIPDDKNEYDPCDDIINLNLSQRTYNACVRAGFKHINDFDNKTCEDLLKYDCIGRKTVDEICRNLKTYYNIEMRRS